MTKRARGAQLEVARIQSEVNRLFETLLRLREGEESVSGWVPPVDMSENETTLVVEAELPGVDPETLEVSAENGNLRLAGKRDPADFRAGEGTEVLHDEREYGTFERIVPLTSAVNTREASARLVNGILRIEFPRVPNRRGQQVTIPFQRG